MSLIINQPVLAQIKIQEEVVLDSNDGIESETLNMPFYGKVKEWISGYSGYGGLTWYDIELGDQSITWGPCAAYECDPQINCFTVTHQQMIFYDIPMGVPIDVSFRYCLHENGQAYFIDLESEVRKTSNVRYEIWGKRPLGTDFLHQGYIEFIETTPPGCENAPVCQTSIPSPSVTNFDYPIFYDESTSYYLNKNRCELNDFAQGFFTLADNEIAEISVQSPCFNLQTQKWQFDVTTPIKIRSVWGLCERDDFTFISSISDIPDSYLCPQNHMKSKFIVDLWARYSNFGTPLYMPKDLVTEEEMIHFAQFAEEINKSEWQNKFSDLYKSEIDYGCTEFTNLEDVKNSIYDEVIIPFRNSILKYLAVDIGVTLELMALKRLEPFILAWETAAYREINNRHCDN